MTEGDRNSISDHIRNCFSRSGRSNRADAKCEIARAIARNRQLLVKLESQHLRNLKYCTFEIARVSVRDVRRSTSHDDLQRPLIGKKGRRQLDTTLLIGYLASTCSVTSFVPQVWKVIKTGDTAAISARMYALTVTGFALWATFGLLRDEWPITLTNSICFCLSAYILIQKIGSHKHR